MKKTDLQAIIKQGEAAIMTQVQNLRLELQQLKLKAARGELKNLRARRPLRRNLAQLLSSLSLVKITKEQS